MNDIGIYITIITIVVGAYLTYNRQLKLKSFEYFFERRKEILNDIEKYLERLYTIRQEIDEQKNAKNLKRYYKNCFHEGLILYHKVKSANFGDTVNILNESYLTIIMEKFEEKKRKLDVSDWILRTTNTLSPLFGFAHSNLNQEMEMLTLPVHKKLSKMIKLYKQKKSETANKSNKINKK